MRLVFILAWLSSLASCHKNYDEQLAPVANQTIDHSTTNISSEQPVAEEIQLTLEVNGYPVEAVQQGKTVKVTKLPETLNIPLTIREFAYPIFLYKKEELEEICKDKNYQKYSHFGLRKINSYVWLNPLTEADVRSAVNNKIYPQMVVEAFGAFKPIDAKTSISAHYLTAEETSRLEEWLNKKFSLDFRSIDFEAFASFEDLEGGNLSKPIMEMGRLVCGIADKEASISFVLSDEQGRSLTTKINSIVFGR